MAAQLTLFSRMIGAWTRVATREGPPRALPANSTPSVAAKQYAEPPQPCFEAAHVHPPRSKSNDGPRPR